MAKTAKIKIAKTELNHYGKPLAEFLACANGYTNYLVTRGVFTEAFCYNISLVNTLKNLATIRKRKYRTNVFYFNAAVSALRDAQINGKYDMLTAAETCISEARKDLQKNNGSLKMGEIEKLSEEIKKQKQEGVTYIS